ncbi:MAG: type II toxin-antitoxin system VapC family toxin [Myxococcales bacterium]|nr:type II toxin-antitoxin system VapC family toxin [Myxococcales bacterium]
MKLLLDTHIALWAISDSPELSQAARRLITEPTNSIWVSAATVWEIAIKHAKRPTDMPISGQQARTYFAAAGYLLLPISAEHAAAIDALPQIHRDPFDRVLVAQTGCESMHLLTHDGELAGYGDAVLVV